MHKVAAAAAALQVTSAAMRAAATVMMRGLSLIAQHGHVLLLLQ
jgi:hypothetical protein